MAVPPIPPSYMTEVPVSSILTGHYESHNPPRKTTTYEDAQLEASIREVGGLICPLIVASWPGMETGKAELLAGMRRLNAWKEVFPDRPILVTLYTLQHPDDAVIMTVTHSTSRKAYLTDEEIAAAIKELRIKCGVSMQRLREIMNMSESRIQYYLNL